MPSRAFHCLLLLWAASGSAVPHGAMAADDAPRERLNVLFIAVDDLRPELGCYGHAQVKTPHMDRLAAAGTLFTRAYCQQAVCNPSRASLMTGLRPDTLRVYDLPTHFRDRAPEAVTIAQLFREQGWHAERVGKIFHTGHNNRDDKLSWSRMKSYPLSPRYGPEGTRLLKELQQAARAEGLDLSRRENQPRGLPWEAPDVDDDALTDGSICRAAIDIMREKRAEPFFLAVGFLNPHLPFVAPKKYWDLYDPSTIELSETSKPPRDAPTYAATSWGELRRYAEMPRSGPLTEEQARGMIHGYWAATSYVDAQVGRLLEELERLELRSRTIVVLWGDHGWHLGDHGFWCKHTNYEQAARVPLIVSVPGQGKPGGRSAALVELVDLLPTLAEGAGLPIPAQAEGTSLLPLLESPTRPWKTAAFHLYPRSLPGHGPGMGRAIRTERYRLVEWRPNKEGDPFREYELYDYETDPAETRNLAEDPSHAAVRRELLARLHAGWRDSLPPRR